MSPARTRPTPLTTEEIVEAALGMSERAGVESLTMRAMARELGVTPMAIYHHVPDKRALMALLLDAVADRFAPLVLDGSGWEECLRRYLLSMWEAQRTYPGLVAHLMAMPGLGVTRARLDMGLRFFEDAGFPPDVAPLAWINALFGWARCGERRHLTITTGGMLLLALTATLTMGV